MIFEFLKHGIRKFTMSFPKNVTKSRKRSCIYKKLKLLEGKLNCNEGKDEYNVWKENLDVIYNEIANEIEIRNRYN